MGAIEAAPIISSCSFVEIEIDVDSLLDPVPESDEFDVEEEGNSDPLSNGGGNPDGEACLSSDPFVDMLIAGKCRSNKIKQ